MLEQHPDNAEVCRTHGVTLECTSLTHNRDNDGAQFRTTDDGLSSLRPRIWLMDNIIYHALRQWAQAHGYGWGQTTAPDPGGRQIWVGDAQYYDAYVLDPTLDRIASATALQLSTLEMIILPINLTNTHWIHAVIHVRDNRIHVEDPFGTPHPAIAARIRTWLLALQQQQGLAPTEWTATYDPTVRQRNGVDCGPFLIGDIMSEVEGASVRLTNGGIPRFREWLAYSLWLSGTLPLTLRTNDPPVTPALQRPLYELPQGVLTTPWERDTTLANPTPMPLPPPPPPNPDDHDGGGGGLG